MHDICLQSKREALAREQDGAEVIPGMEFMMNRYESELKKPIRNLVSGQLARSLLIQVVLLLLIAGINACGVLSDWPVAMDHDLISML